MGRMLIELHKIHLGKPSLYALMVPDKYESFVKAVRILSCESTQMGLALTIYVKQLAMLKVSLCTEQGDRHGKELAQSFLDLYNANWSARVSASIGKRQRLSKLNKGPELPLEEDLLQLTSFIDMELSKECETQKLKKLCLASLLLFNKRRPMEIHEMTVQDFLQAKEKSVDPHDQEVLAKLSSTERMIADR